KLLDLGCRWQAVEHALQGAAPLIVSGPEQPDMARWRWGHQVAVVTNNECEARFGQAQVVQHFGDGVFGFAAPPVELLDYAFRVIADADHPFPVGQIAE